jgi:hypothetical protein
MTVLLELGTHGRRGHWSYLLRAAANAAVTIVSYHGKSRSAITEVRVG